MTGSFQTTVYVVWDEEGEVAAHVDQLEAIEQLKGISSGEIRRVVALKLTLPIMAPLEMDVAVASDEMNPSVQRI